MQVQRFVLPSETSGLSEAELGVALRCLDWVSETMVERRRRQEREGAAFAVHMPAAVWDPTQRQGFERDLAVTNPFNSFDLVMSRNPAVLRQLRLYCQAFTGYQLATLEMAHRRPWIRKPLPANLDDLVDMLVYLPDPGVQLYARLVEKMPPQLRIRPPPRFGEFGWLIDGCLASYDTFYYLQRIALFHEGGILDRLADIARTRRPRILEIGGGFGGLAHYLSVLNPGIEYTIVDLPESLAFSSVYLSVLHPNVTIDLVSHGKAPSKDASFRLCPNFLMDETVPNSTRFDLVINTASLNEMAPEQVSFYASRIAPAIGADGIFFEHNGEANKFGLQSLRSVLSTYFARFKICPATLVGDDISPGPAYLWSN
jgi:hypothetical protein